MVGIGLHELIVLWFLFGLLPGFFMLVSVLRHEFTGNNKLIWLLVTLLIPFPGWILYLIIGRHQRVKSPGVAG